MQSGQAFENKSSDNKNADLEKILKNILESPRFHEYAEKFKLEVKIPPRFSVEFHLTLILCEAIFSKDVDFVRYILESFEHHCKAILNRRPREGISDCPVFWVISDPEKYTKLTKDVERCIQNEKDILSLLLRYGAEIHSQGGVMGTHQNMHGYVFHGSLMFDALLKGNFDLLKFILNECKKMSKEERKNMVKAVCGDTEWSFVALMLYMRHMRGYPSCMNDEIAFEMAVQLYAFCPESFRMNNSMLSNFGDEDEVITDFYFYMNFLMTDSMLLMAERSCDNVLEKLKLKFMRSVREALNKFNCVTGLNGVALDAEKLTQFLNGINDEKWKFSMDPALAISHMPQKYAAQFLKNILAIHDAEIILKAASQFKKHLNYNEILDECADSIWNFLVSLSDEKINEYIRTVNKAIDQFYVSRWQIIDIESVDGSNARLDELGSLIASIIFMASARYEELESGYTSELKTLLMSYLRMGGDPEKVMFGKWESNNQLIAINKNFSSHAPEVWAKSLSRIPDEYYFLMFCRGQLDSLIYYVDQIKLVAVTNRNICNKIESFGSLLHDQSRRPNDVLQDVSELWCSLRENLECYVLSTKDSRVSFFKGTEDNIALVLESIDAIFAHYQIKMGVQLLPHQSMK